MATSASPTGLVPVKLLNGTPYAGAFRQYDIANNYGTNIFNGSLVKINTAGVVELMVEQGTNGDQFDATTIGVLVGCSYTDPNTSQLTFQNYYPANTAASDIKAFVVDDPDVLFRAQCDGALTAGVGSNIHLANVQSTSTGSTLTGRSNVALDASEAAATATFGLRIVELVDDGLNSPGDAFTEVLVKIQIGDHSFTQTTGVATS